MKAIVMITIVTGEIPAAVKQLKRLRPVSEAYMTLGPFDAVAIVETGGLDELGKLVADEIQPIPGVEKTLTCVAVES